MIDHLDLDLFFSDIRKMTGDTSISNKEPLYKKSPWLPRGQVRKFILLGLMVLGGYGSTRHWFFFVLLLVSMIALSPKLLLATAYYYGKSALFLSQLFCK